MLAGPLLLGSAACREPLAGFGAGGRGRAGAEQFVQSFADRHLVVTRNPRYEYARVQISRGALAPSRVFDDTAAWTGSSGSVRLLETFGSISGSTYHLASRAGVPAPMRLADGRHATTLSRLSDNEFRWDTSVDFALGSVRPAEVADVIARLLAAGEGHTPPSARAEIAALAPRTSAALGTVFTLDALEPEALADGSTIVTAQVTVSGERLRRRFPLFGDYVRRYVEPARFRLTLADRGGTPYLEARQRDRVISLRLRTHHGALVPLAGPLRPLPDTLELALDFTMRVKLWSVGFHDLHLEFVNAARGEREREWVLTARREPGWNLPMIGARIMRAPLRRPFLGEGSLFRLGVRAGENGAPTVLVRQSRLFVQESPVLRFLNSLGSTAMDDFAGRTEVEENLWLRELFLALRDDIHDALTPP